MRSLRPRVVSLLPEYPSFAIFIDSSFKGHQGRLSAFLFDRDPYLKNRRVACTAPMPVRGNVFSFFSNTLPILIWNSLPFACLFASGDHTYPGIPHSIFRKRRSFRPESERMLSRRRNSIGYHLITEPSHSTIDQFMARTSIIAA